MPNLVNFKTVPTDVPLSAENVDRIAARAAELATAFKTRIDKLQATFAEARDRYSREADTIVAEAGPEHRATAKQFAKQQEASKIAKYRITLAESSRPQREEVLRPLAKLAADAEFLLTLNQSPAQALCRVALGDPRRTHYLQQLETAGDVELTTAAVTAIATNDLPLAAAVATICDRRPSSRRPFAVGEFAERVWGRQHAEVVTKLKGAILAHKTSVAADAEFVRGKGDSLTNLSLQLAQRAIDQATGTEA